MDIFRGSNYILKLILASHSKICHDSSYPALGLNPVAFRTAKTPERFGHSECNRVSVFLVRK